MKINLKMFLIGAVIGFVVFSVMLVGRTGYRECIKHNSAAECHTLLE